MTRTPPNLADSQSRVESVDTSYPWVCYAQDSLRLLTTNNDYLYRRAHTAGLDGLRLPNEAKGCSMQSYLLTELVDIEKREEPRRRCSVYVNFSSGHHIATARILDYSDSGFRMRTSGKVQLGRTIEILDTEHSTFESRFGRVVWQRLLKDGSKEFGVHLVRQPEKLTAPSSLHVWETLQQLAFEEAFA